MDDIQVKESVNELVEMRDVLIALEDLAKHIDKVEKLRRYIDNKIAEAVND